MFVHACFTPTSNIGWHPQLMLTFYAHSRIPSANIRSKFIRVSWIPHPPFLDVFEERTTIKRKSLMVRRSVRSCIMRDISNHQISPYCVLYFVILSSIILEYRCLSLILRNFVIAIQYFLVDNCENENLSVVLSGKEFRQEIDFIVANRCWSVHPVHFISILLKQVVGPKRF